MVLLATLLLRAHARPYKDLSHALVFLVLEEAAHDIVRWARRIPNSIYAEEEVRAAFQD